MSLYRKYRPQTFADVIGQDHITTTITNQIRTGTLSHAYLFCGTRGTGKTTVARLVARAINCTETDLALRPCNVCDNCQAILRGASPNVIEIDAASNNGVENIRDILEEVKYPPVTGKYKIYVIDEVHMLSIGAFNALLKTLEEPPAHVVFILATTDPHKVPATIHSRCQRYEFRRIATQQLASNIDSILASEGVSMDSDGVWLVATLGDGSARDSLSLLGQALAFYGGTATVQGASLPTITAQQVRDMLGMVDNSVLFGMTGALIAQDALAVVSLIHDMAGKGRDFTQFVMELLGHLRNLTLAKLVDKPSELLALDQTSFEQTVAQSKSISQGQLQTYIDVLTELSYKIKTEKNQKILLEVSLIKLAHMGQASTATVTPTATMAEPVARVAPGPQATTPAPPVASPLPTEPRVEVVQPTAQTVQPTVGTPQPQAAPPQAPAPQPTPIATPAPVAQPTATPADGDSLNFPAFVAAQPVLLKTLLQTCKLTHEYDTIYVETSAASMVLLKSKEEEIKAGAQQFFGKAFDVIVTDGTQKKTRVLSPSVNAPKASEPVAATSSQLDTAPPPPMTTQSDTVHPTDKRKDSASLTGEQKDHIQTHINMPVTFI